MMLYLTPYEEAMVTYLIIGVLLGIGIVIVAYIVSKF